MLVVDFILTYYLPTKNLIGKVKVKGELVSYQKFPKEIEDFQKKNHQNNTLPSLFCPEAFVNKPNQVKTRPPLPIIWTGLSGGYRYVGCTE